MNQRTISLKPVQDIMGMNFYIPDYQRGYRWKTQQAIDLLNDIASFASKSKNSAEIYCIQPLVVQQKEEDILTKIKSASSLLEVEKYMRGSWNVIDGQQRLTTIYLILSQLSTTNEERYIIDYQTRTGSKDFLGNPVSEKKLENVDYYHMYCVYEAIGIWFKGKDDTFKEEFKNVLLKKVCFIWYQIENKGANDAEYSISVFTRLNIGKIPLTDSELIKALFLNRSNFNTDVQLLETEQREIASEWDDIEYNLQNDEFWLFIHGKDYNNPTRIDYILDMISENDKLKLYKNSKGKQKKNREQIEKENSALKDKIGEDDHKTFRYFYEAFNVEHDKNNEGVERIDKIWKEIKKHYQIFDEWYHDYKLYHYVGYLSTISNDSKLINSLIDSWGPTKEGSTKEGSTKEGSTKDEFVKKLRKRISDKLKGKKWISEWKNYNFEDEGHVAKTDCVELLLLHNIETIVKQNEKLISDKKYNLPNFTKFPFHLYKNECWQVEHIRPNSGDNFKKEDTKKAYLLIAKQYLKDKDELYSKINDYVMDQDDHEPFADIIERVNEQGSPLSEEDKNKIWNYTLLDESTNKEYGNAIFPVKRAFITNKEQGYKVQYKVMPNGELQESERIPEIAFIPPCTKNAFSKFYTSVPSTMIAWTKDDAEAYLRDMEDKIGEFITCKEKKNE